MEINEHHASSKRQTKQKPKPNKFRTRTCLTSLTNREIKEINERQAATFKKNGKHKQNTNKPVSDAWLLCQILGEVLRSVETNGSRRKS
jgi:hypothetical protein